MPLMGPHGSGRHNEAHRIERIGWLRAAVLGANDGIVWTASLVIGVAASQATHAGRFCWRRGWEPRGDAMRT